MEENLTDEINQMNLPFLDRVDLLDHLRIIRLKGPLDHETLPDMLKFRDHLVKTHNTRTLNLLLDLAKVTKVDSSAIATLFLRLKEIHAEDRHMGLVHVPTAFKMMLEVFKNSGHVKIFDSEEDAVLRLNTSS